MGYLVDSSSHYILGVRARAEGKQIGRPKKVVDRKKVKALRKAGMSYRAIGQKMGASTMWVHGVCSDATAK